MSRNKSARKQYSEELKREAVQMLLDGYSATSVCSNLGISSPTLLHKWRKKYVAASPEAETLDAQIRELREELRRVERERDILKKALSIFSQRM
jgi:transposase